MAAISLSIARGTGESDLGQAGSQSVTVGSSAPGAGDVEVRFSSAALAGSATGQGMTSREAKELLDIIWRFILEGYVQDGASAVWPNL